MNAPPKSKRKLISQMLVTLVSFGLFVYFGFHLMHGEMGYFALRGVNQKLAAAEEKHAVLAVERAELENRVKLLRPGSLDLDMLEERARIVLGFARPDDKVILEKTADSSGQ